MEGLADLQGSMFWGMATGAARPGRYEALAQAVLEPAGALRRKPGCVGGTS